MSAYKEPYFSSLANSYKLNIGDSLTTELQELVKGYPFRLNLGCGITGHKRNWINVDNRKECKPQLVWDIGREKSNLQSSCVEQIHAHHSFEHFPNFIEVVHELARISKPNCKWIVTVPYATSTVHNLINPYHLEHFTEHKFRFFDDIYQQEGPRNFNIKTLNVDYVPNRNLWPDKHPKWLVENRHRFLNCIREITFTLKVEKKK